MKKNLTVYIQLLVTFTFCFMLFCQLPAMAQTQSDDAKKGVLPNYMHDTRSLSMASTTIADLYGKPSVSTNAALSGLFNKSSFFQLNSNHNWDNNLMQHNLSLPTLSFGSHHFTTRFSYFHRGFDILSFTSSSSLPEPVMKMYRTELAYAITISDYLSIGTLQSISFTTASDETPYWNYFADIGLVYAPDDPVSYGIVFRGLGLETTYENLETGHTTLGSRMARQILEIGLTFRYPVEERTYLSISFANEKRFGEEGLWYKGGIEIIPVSSFNIRGGVISNFNQSRYIPRIGFGVNVSVLQIDYMMAPENLNGVKFHQIGLTIQL